MIRETLPSRIAASAESASVAAVRASRGETTVGEAALANPALGGATSPTAPPRVSNQSLRLAGAMCGVAGALALVGGMAMALTAQAKANAEDQRIAQKLAPDPGLESARTSTRTVAASLDVLGGVLVITAAIVSAVPEFRSRSVRAVAERVARGGVFTF